MIKQYRRLRDIREERYAHRLFVAEGNKLCMEAAASGLEITTLLYAPERCRNAEALSRLTAAAGSSYALCDSLADYIADTEAPQGVFCVCRMPEEMAFVPQPAGRYLLLERLQNPGNVGTVIRTAEAMGIDGVVLSADCADIWSPKTLRSAMGSVFRMPLYVCGSMPDCISGIRSAGLACCAAALTDDAADIRRVSFEHGGALVIGNEGSGVTREVIEACSGCVIIPMAGETESLNAAAAAALSLWELSGKYLPEVGG